MVRWWFLVCAMLALKSLDVASYRTKRIEYATSLFEECESHRECKNLKYTECWNGYCRCLPNYFPRKNKYHACYGGINTTCDSNNDCNGNDQVGCISNTCQSYETFFSSSNTEVIKLYRAERIGSRCATDENCSDLDKTQCRAGKCKCVRGYWLDKNICRPVTNVICADDSDCEERGTKCILEQCVLPEDFFDESNAHNSNLYTANNYGDICGTDHHCRNINNT
ncbi:integrin beta-5-like [Cotesia glomerata]|uniref:integrin beta-5-like n=1 Tax=Cotesia glomerata TaxID=32391 RepID=UPI001D0170B9|nr:integrin beta-5-like [Cotesia glomerata]